jgi:AcrR family transcriptional regulator
VILSAVRGIVAERGRDAVTVVAVAEACGVPTSRATVQKYFPGGRERLLEAVAE